MHIDFTVYMSIWWGFINSVGRQECTITCISQTEDWDQKDWVSGEVSHSRNGAWLVDLITRLWAAARTAAACSLRPGFWLLSRVQPLRASWPLFSACSPHTLASLCLSEAPLPTTRLPSTTAWPQGWPLFPSSSSRQLLSLEVFLWHSNKIVCEPLKAIVALSLKYLVIW